MILPTTYITTLILAILCLVCWGSWATTRKMNNGWRFELYSVDFAVGLMLAAVVAAATFGTISSGFVETDILMLSVWDNLTIARKTSLGLAFAGGGLFCLGNLLLMATIAIAGLSVAFPLGIGVAVLTGVLWGYFLGPQTSPVLLGGGSLAMVASVIVSALSYRSLLQDKAALPPPADAALEAQPVVDARKSRPGHGRSTPAKASSNLLKTVLLGVGSGLLIGSFMPLVALSRESEIGLGPYTAAVMVAIGVLLSTPAYVLVLMNLPIEGDTLGIGNYFGGGLKNHLLGILGGCLWGVGAIAYFVAGSAPKSADFSPATVQAAGYGAAVLAALWGLVAWKEYASARGKTLGLVAVALLLFAGGVGLVALAQL
jgi:glucose uptake protein